VFGWPQLIHGKNVDVGVHGQAASEVAGVRRLDDPSLSELTLESDGCLLAIRQPAVEILRVDGEAEVGWPILANCRAP